jgi:hypothetical protein
MAFPRTLALALAVLTSSSLASAGEDVPFDTLPAPVKATVQREVKTGQILEIERDTKKGAPVFEVEFSDPNGVKWELDIAPDGTLLSRRED